MDTAQRVSLALQCLEKNDRHQNHCRREKKQKRSHNSPNPENGSFH
jgi:hypothetical protein